MFNLLILNLLLPVALLALIALVWRKLSAMSPSGALENFSVRLESLDHGCLRWATKRSQNS